MMLIEIVSGPGSQLFFHTYTGGKLQETTMNTNRARRMRDSQALSKAGREIASNEWQYDWACLDPRPGSTGASETTAKDSRLERGWVRSTKCACACVRVCLPQLNSTRIGKHTDEPADRETVRLGADQEERTGYMVCPLPACFPRLPIPQLASQTRAGMTITVDVPGPICGVRQS